MRAERGDSSSAGLQLKAQPSERFTYAASSEIGAMWVYGRRSHDVAARQVVLRIHPCSLV